MRCRDEVRLLEKGFEQNLRKLGVGIEAVAFSNSMNEGCLPTGEHEDTGIGLKLSLQLGQIQERNSVRCFFSCWLPLL